MDWLKQILNEYDINLSDEQYDNISKKQVLNFVPKKEFNSRLDEIKNLKSTVSDNETNYNNLLSQYNSLNDSYAEKESNLRDYETKITELNNNISKEKFNNTLINSLLNHKARNPITVIPLLDLSSVTLDDNNLTGLKNQLESIKENHSYLFYSDSADSSNTIWAGSKGNFPREIKKSSPSNNLNQAINSYYSKKH